MGLVDHLPSIDDRRFDDIVREIRARVVRYAPEYTDLNDNEPGMAILQVYAWLADMQLYRLGLVPEASYLRFLELIGIELTPAQPATAQVRFPPVPTGPAPLFIVPTRTEVSATVPGEPPIVFETRRGLTVLRAQLADAQLEDPAGHVLIDLTAGGFDPFGAPAIGGSSLLLGLQDAATPPAPIPSAVIDVTVWVPDTLPSAPTPCGPNLPPPSDLIWEYWSGSVWVELKVLYDDTGALTRSGRISLRLPAAGSIPSVQVGAVAEPRSWLRVRLDRIGYDRPPRLVGIAIDAVDVEQAESVSDEVLGGSDGSPSQVFHLDRTPIVAGSLVIEIDEGEGFAKWEQVADFGVSGTHDLHYVLNRTTGEVRVGDGMHGAIPRANIANPTGNVLARRYRSGGGRLGNVPARAISALVSAVDGIDPTVSNPFPAAGGRDEETIDEAKRRAPRTVRSNGRAVTEGDFERLAQEASNVMRAKALPLFHPGYPSVPMPGVVTVIVVPDAEGTHPYPSDATRRGVCAYLDARRLTTTELYVIGPTYRRVQVDVDVLVQDGADLAAVRQEIESRLLTYLHPLTGGEDRSGWPFGGTISFSLIDRQVFLTPGVARVDRLVLTVDGTDIPECRNIPIGPGELVYSEEHLISVSYEER